VSDSLNWGGRDFSPYALGAPVPAVKFEPLDFDSKTVGRLIDNAKWHGLKEQRAMEKTHIVRNSGYTREALAPDLSDMVTLVKESLPEEVDTIVGTGLSGTLVVPHLGRALGLHWGIMRKSSEGSHASEMYEGTMGRRWALVDDFVSSGDTVKRVLANCFKEFGERTDWGRPTWDTEFQGVIQYSRAYQAWLSREDLAQYWTGIRREMEKVGLWPTPHLTSAPAGPEVEGPQVERPGVVL
jgi:hypothetical protein